MPIKEVQRDSRLGLEKQGDSSLGSGNTKTSWHPTDVSSSGGEDKPLTPAQEAKKMISQIEAMKRFSPPKEVPISDSTSSWIEKNSSMIAGMVVEITNTSNRKLGDNSDFRKFVESLSYNDLKAFCDVIPLVQERRNLSRQVIELVKQSEALKKIREEAANLELGQKELMEVLSAAASSSVRGESIAFPDLQRHIDAKERGNTTQIIERWKRLQVIDKHLPPMKEPIKTDLDQLTKRAAEERIDLRNITGEEFRGPVRDDHKRIVARTARLAYVEDLSGALPMLRDLLDKKTTLEAKSRTGEAEGTEIQRLEEIDNQLLEGWGARGPLPTKDERRELRGEEQTEESKELHEGQQPKNKPEEEELDQETALQRWAKLTGS